MAFTPFDAETLSGRPPSFPSRGKVTRFHRASIISPMSRGIPDRRFYSSYDGRANEGYTNREVIASRLPRPVTRSGHNPKVRCMERAAIKRPAPFRLYGKVMNLPQSQGFVESDPGMATPGSRKEVVR
jgi:hypothetical protein